MREILTIARFRWRGVRNDLARRPDRRAGACLLIVLYPLGAYWAYRGFEAVLRGWARGDVQRLSGSALLLLGILALAYLLGLVSAAKEFLANPQAPLLLVAPVKASSLLWTKYLAVLADRNLEIAIILLGAPCLLAMRTSGVAQALHLFPCFFASVLLVNLVAVATVLLIVRHLWHRRKIALWLGAGLLILLGVSLISVIRNSPAGLVPGTLHRTTLPWLLRVLARPFPTSLILTLVLLLILWGLAWCLSRIYAPAWSRSQETSLVISAPDSRVRRWLPGWVQHLRSPYWGATWAILLKDWRTMGRSPLFPLRLLIVPLSWAAFLVMREQLNLQSPLLAIPLVVAYVLLCLQVSVGELTANAFAGEGDRLSLILTAPLSPWRVLRAKLIAHVTPLLVVGAASALVLGMLISASPLHIGLAVLLTCFIAGANTTLLVGGSVVAADLSAGISGPLEEILFEETFVAPASPRRLALVVVSVAFQAANVALLCLPYWWRKAPGAFSGLSWSGLTALFIAANSAAAFAALRVGIAGFPRLTAR